MRAGWDHPGGGRVQASLAAVELSRSANAGSGNGNSISAKPAAKCGCRRAWTATVNVQSESQAAPVPSTGTGDSDPQSCAGSEGGATAALRHGQMPTPKTSQASSIADDAFVRTAFIVGLPAALVNLRTSSTTSANGSAPVRCAVRAVRLALGRSGTIAALRIRFRQLRMGARRSDASPLYDRLPGNTSPTP